MHGVDGWKLADYDWDPETGLARITYERAPGRTPDRRSTVDRAGRETIRMYVPQPASSRHAGWKTDRHVRAFVERDTDFPVRHF